MTRQQRCEIGIELNPGLGETREELRPASLRLSCPDLAAQLGANDLLGATLCAFVSSDSIGTKCEHIGTVIVTGHIQVELATRNVVQIQVRN